MEIEGNQQNFIALIADSIGMCVLCKLNGCKLIQNRSQGHLLVAVQTFIYLLSGHIYNKQVEYGEQLLASWPLTRPSPFQLRAVVFCSRTEGLMTMARPPRSRCRRDQSLLIRNMGVEESALVWVDGYQRRLQLAEEDNVIFANIL